MHDPPPASINPLELERIIDAAIAEDLVLGDPTTDSLVPADLNGAARFVARGEGVVAGLEVGLGAFRRVDPQLQGIAHAGDGQRCEPGETLAAINGPIAGMLKAERTALNLLQRMSGIATATADYVEAVRGTKATIIDTRKTAPGLRALDKYAVSAGGGGNHRHNLGDLVLIKDNHIAAMAGQGLSLAEVVRTARSRARFNLRIEVECDTLEQVREALEGGADIIMLDNMSVDRLREAVSLVRGRALAEASGNVTLESVRAIAETGVDMISVGALTHSVKALDIGLDYET